MKRVQVIFFAFIFLIFVPVNAQTAVENVETTQSNSIFSQEEEEYIDQWFAEFVQEMNLSEEVALKYQNIINKYSTKMDDIGKDDSNVTKSEIMEQFHALMEDQHEEVQSILTDEQYEMYYDTMGKVIWSINQRLKQL